MAEFRSSVLTGHVCQGEKDIEDKPEPTSQEYQTLALFLEMQPSSLLVAHSQTPYFTLKAFWVQITVSHHHKPGDRYRTCPCPLAPILTSFSPGLHLWDVAVCNRHLGLILPCPNQKNKVPTWAMVAQPLNPSMLRR